MASMNDYIKKMLNESKMRRRRTDLELGTYVVVIRGLTYERREKREKLGKAFWIDYQILEADEGKGSEPGTKLDFPIVPEGQYADMAFDDIKTFLVELTGCEPDKSGEQWEKYVDTVNDEGKHSNPSQPARGLVILAETYERMTQSGKNKGKMKVYPRWIHAPEGNSDAEVAKRRAELDAEDKKAAA